MVSESTRYTNFGSVEDWPMPKLEPIVARVEWHFGAKCKEVILVVHGVYYKFTSINSLHTLTILQGEITPYFLPGFLFSGF